VQRYVVNIASSDRTADTRPFDGVAEISYPDRDGLRAAAQSAESAATLADEANLFDPASIVRMFVDEYVILCGQRVSPAERGRAAERSSISIAGASAPRSGASPVERGRAAERSSISIAGASAPRSGASPVERGRAAERSSINAEANQTI
jgi:hypothetical protein